MHGVHACCRVTEFPVATIGAETYKSCYPRATCVMGRKKSTSGIKYTVEIM